ncbi:sugar phosphate isomerase/epimerase family protein [Pseudarthrobacter oxydans]|uniref:sugar phosphate isomerase/epimerase family protein n=1 Tax=Pseudarthrobacter oxydans TaxID=1671 RepID=UPI0037F2AD7F
MGSLTLERVTGTNFAYNNVRFETFLGDMIRLGRRRIELWAIAPHFSIPEASAQDVTALKRQLQEREMVLHCLTPEQIMYPVNLASEIPWIRDSSIKMFSKAADIASELEGNMLFLTPGRGFEDADPAEAWNRSIDGTRQVVDYAASRGIRCVVECLQRSESNLVYSLEGLKRFISEVNHENLTAALDTPAMAAAGDSIEDYVNVFGDRLSHVHLVDGSPSGHLAWGDGSLPLGHYLRVLNDAGYTGMMSFEIFGARYASDPGAAHERSLTAVRAALEGLPAAIGARLG